MLRHRGPDTLRIAQNLSENQCIFIRGFRVISRTWSGRTLKAMAEPSDMPEPGPDKRLEHISVVDSAKVSFPGSLFTSYV
jgi:hypothetical protein